MKWEEWQEKKLIALRESGMAYKDIGIELGVTESSVKHKYIRIKQRENDDKYHHPKEKTEQVLRVMREIGKNHVAVLETHCGNGNLTSVYNLYGEVLAHDIDPQKVEFVKSKAHEGVDVYKCDSEKEIHRHVWHNLFFDIVDVDPYGFPSRFFPHILHLLKDGFLILTFPKIGVQQINKIMIEHYRVFWDVDIKDSEQEYRKKIIEKVKDYGFMLKKEVALFEYIDLGRTYRFVFKVKTQSMLELVGLKVKGVNCDT